MNFLIIISMVMSLCRSDVVTTVQGQIRGVHGNGFISYMGIPYASVTDKTNRFKKAGIAPVWGDIREALSSTCSASSSVQECLQLDVHVPTTGSSPWPVFAWVRGGSGYYSPDKLVNAGIIVVVVSHRFGPSGFVCMRDEMMPGNAGVKDVITALRWVRDNIVAFRGNPARVVVAGQGFGAAIVEALAISPITEDLFHGLILQSGTVLSPVAFNYDPEARASTLKSVVNILNADEAEISSIAEKLEFPYFSFGICIEKPVTNEELVFSKAPFHMLTDNRLKSVPMIIGYNSNEGYIFSSMLRKVKVLKRMTKYDLEFLVPEGLKFSNSREMNQVTQNIMSMYFDHNITIAGIITYYSDALFISHMHRSAKLHAAGSSQPVYYYQFSHKGDIGVVPEPGVQKTGAAHGDELAYLFSQNGRRYDGLDGTVQDNLVGMWTDFVKHLNPTPPQFSRTTWEPLSPYDPRVLDISAELKMIEFPRTREALMWEDIYEKYYYSRYH